MPEYSFLCEKCNYKFCIVCSIADYSSEQKCDRCLKSENVTRLYQEDLSSLNTSVRKGDGELKTLGDLANRNRDKMSDDQKLALHNKHNDYKEQPAKTELPKGMTRLKKQPKTKWI
jgi:hypothetical protein